MKPGQGMTMKQRAEEIVSRWPDIAPKSDEEMVINDLTVVMETVAKQAREEAIEECASKCCSIDASDISHETAESNAKAIRALNAIEKDSVK